MSSSRANERGAYCCRWHCIPQKTNSGRGQYVLPQAIDLEVPIQFISGFDESVTDGDSMKVDFTTIKLPAVRIVAGLCTCTLEVVIDGIFVIATNAMIQPSFWTSSLPW